MEKVLNTMAITRNVNQSIMLQFLLMLCCNCAQQDLPDPRLAQEPNLRRPPLTYNEREQLAPYIAQHRCFSGQVLSTGPFGGPVANASIQFLLAGNELGKTTSDSTGTFNWCVDRHKNDALDILIASLVGLRMDAHEDTTVTLSVRIEHEKYISITHEVTWFTGKSLHIDFHIEKQQLALPRDG